MCACSITQLCLTLCNPMDCSLPGASVYGAFLERILEWVAISSSSNSWYILPNFSPEHTVKDLVVLVVQLYQTLCDPTTCDYSPPGSSVHGISEQEHWSGLPFPSHGHRAAVSSSRPRDWTYISCTGSGFLTIEPQCYLFIFNLLILCLMTCAHSHASKAS